MYFCSNWMQRKRASWTSRARRNWWKRSEQPNLLYESLLHPIISIVHSVGITVKNTVACFANEIPGFRATIPRHCPKICRQSFILVKFCFKKYLNWISVEEVLNRDNNFGQLWPSRKLLRVLKYFSKDLSSEKFFYRLSERKLFGLSCDEMMRWNWICMINFLGLLSSFVKEKKKVCHSK